MAVTVEDGVGRHQMPHVADEQQCSTMQRAETCKLGFALDEGEQEVGVRCVAVALRDAPRPKALSIWARDADGRRRREQGRSGAA